jgi:hypothetical protein
MINSVFVDCSASIRLQIAGVWSAWRSEEIRLSSKLWSLEIVVLFDMTGKVVGLSDIFKVRFLGAHNEINARALG